MQLIYTGAVGIRNIPDEPHHQVTKIRLSPVPQTASNKRALYAKCCLTFFKMYHKMTNKAALSATKKNLCQCLNAAPRSPFITCAKSVGAAPDVDSLEASTVANNNPEIHFM